MSEDEMRTLLLAYSNWLEEHGYMDCDWWAEDPNAVGRFIEEEGK